MRERDLILEVFTKKGDEKTYEEAMQTLTEILSDENYIKKKANGSLGGSVASGFLERNGNVYKRVK